MSCYFRIIWLDPPGLIPTDIRYRHILVSVDAMALRNNPAGYVYRIMFKCSGSCMRMDEGPCHLQEGNTASKLDGSSFVGDNDAYDQPAQPGETRGPKSRKKRPAACDSMLMVSSKHRLLLFHYPTPPPLDLVLENVYLTPPTQLEMTARQAANGQCTIVRRRPEIHPAGPANALRMSAYVRSVLHELAAQTGMPHHRLRYGKSAGQIDKLLPPSPSLGRFKMLSVQVLMFFYVEYEERLRYAPYPAMLETHLPHRAPKPRHYPSVVTTITRNQQKPNTEGSGD